MVVLAMAVTGALFLTRSSGNGDGPATTTPPDEIEFDRVAAEQRLLDACEDITGGAELCQCAAETAFAELSEEQLRDNDQLIRLGRDLLTEEVTEILGRCRGEPELTTGDLQVTLRWSTEADLDLAVTDPLGEQVNVGNPEVASGGLLDVDANRACTDLTNAPVENIVWASNPPPGEYDIMVSISDDCGSGEGPHDFTLVVRGDAIGPSPRQEMGRVSIDDRDRVFPLEIP
jgi:hypothetical protein